MAGRLLGACLTPRVCVTGVRLCHAVQCTPSRTRCSNRADTAHLYDSQPAAAGGRGAAVVRWSLHACWFRGPSFAITHRSRLGPGYRVAQRLRVAADAAAVSALAALAEVAAPTCSRM